MTNDIFKMLNYNFVLKGVKNIILNYLFQKTLILTA